MYIESIDRETDLTPKRSQRCKKAIRQMIKAKTSLIPDIPSPHNITFLC